MKYIKDENKFHLCNKALAILRNMKEEFGYGAFGAVCFYRTYSRKKADSKNESWFDVVVRVINGTMTIRKNHYANNTIYWDEEKWQEYALRLAVSMFKMEWLPPGRGLWAMGADFLAERGSMALFNCAFTELTGVGFAEDIRWFMDCLMMGVGVGFRPDTEEIPLSTVTTVSPREYIIPDTREGWCESVKIGILGEMTLTEIQFDYSLVRPYGAPIKTFGGLASGPEPLMKLHQSIREEFAKCRNDEINVVELKTNIANMVGKCVVAGNVRRSAELGMAPITDETFLDLKDYDKYPHRQEYGYLSNNTVTLSDSEDFDMLGLVAERVPVRGEPGIANLKNFNVGRVGRRNKYPVRKDKATGLNPCGEITLEHREVCNLAETFPTRCENVEGWFDACEHAAFYCSTVSLLPTHDPSTNAVMLRNRRIGVGIVDYTNWVASESLHKVVSYLNEGYRRIRKVNKDVNAEAGVPEAIKVTTIKPGGTVPKLAGCVSGMSYPTFNHTLRRINVAAVHPIAQLLKDARVPHVENPFDSKTLIFSFPILQKGTPAEKVTLWEQAFNLITLQQHWSDNAVSNTLYFRPKWRLIYSRPQQTDGHNEIFEKYLHDDDVEPAQAEVLFGSGEWQNSAVKLNIKDGMFNVSIFDPEHEEDIIERVLAHTAPHIKSLSLLPHSAKGAYLNMPEEGIPEAVYNAMVDNMLPIDWSKLSGSDGIDEKYCQGDVCAL